MRSHDIFSEPLYHLEGPVCQRSLWQPVQPGNGPGSARPANRATDRPAHTGEHVFKKYRAENPRSTEEKRRFITKHRFLLESNVRGCVLMN